MIGRSRRAGLTALVVLAMLTGCSGHKGAVASRPGAHQDLTLTVRTTPALGSFLVVDGWTLYIYPPDHQRSVTCTKAGDCVTAWPPLFLSVGHKVVAGPGVKPALIGTISGDGGKVVTYNHWPLYYYIGDHQALDVNGQDQGFNWYVIAPDGVPTKTGPNGGPA
jgi:predicted lipoprotein with Yx(FWY)xxD motif